MPEFSSQPFVDIARRLEMRAGHSWVAVLSPLNDPTAACDELSIELRSFLQLPTRVLPLKNFTFDGLREAVQHPSDDVVVLFVDSALGADAWSSLDLMRSALERDGPVVVWMAPDSVAELTKFAPNIRSFIGSSIFLAAPDGGVMTEAERQCRLKELAQHYGISNEEIVRRAESKELSPEPHFVEWLVLLGRGDLV